MSHSPMTLTLESVKARRQEILDVAVTEYVRQGKAADQVTRVELPSLIAKSEDRILDWLMDLDDIGIRRRLSLAGFISEDFVAWQVDGIMWFHIHTFLAKDLDPRRDVWDEFNQKYPMPAEECTPWTRWVADVVEATQMGKKKAIEALKADVERLEDLRAKKAEITEE
ncbi:hypothetical protein PG993_005505 [Apiospora rasikravindrae]|uniref:Uncharacterized protein n=1 Tax=Apiospora rasikravindrae TaxID=990691 RepID=A0ABR1TFR9_9PEZI